MHCVVVEWDCERKSYQLWETSKKAVIGYEQQLQLLAYKFWNIWKGHIQKYLSWSTGRQIGPFLRLVKILHFLTIKFWFFKKQKEYTFNTTWIMIFYSNFIFQQYVFSSKGTLEYDQLSLSELVSGYVEFLKTQPELPRSSLLSHLQLLIDNASTYSCASVLWSDNDKIREYAHTFFMHWKPQAPRHLLLLSPIRQERGQLLSHARLGTRLKIALVTLPKPVTKEERTTKTTLRICSNRAAKFPALIFFL